MDRLELVKAIAPYVTAVVAVLAAAFTASLSHRNWLKQFAIQRSEALLKEQIRLMQEVPKMLNDAIAVAIESLYALACSDAFARVKRTTDANSLIDDFRSGQTKLTELLRELEVPEIAVRLYFGPEASLRISEFRSMLLSSSMPSVHSERACAAIVGVLQTPELLSSDIQVLQSRLYLVVLPHIEPAFAAAKELRLSAVRTMASRINVA